MGQAETLNRVEAEIRFKKDKERSYVVDADGQVVLTKDGDALVICFTQEEMQLMRGKVLTHNHPSGGSFSDQDVQFLLTVFLKQIRAVGSRYKYSMLLPKDPVGVFFAVQQQILGVRRATRELLLERVSQGELTQQEAGQEFMHLVWSQLGHELGLRYERERWSDAQD